MGIPEDFLHYVWRMKRFDLDRLETTDGEPIELLDFGQYNTDAGPDFLNARLKIGQTVWAGNVEMHIRASDWARHQHHQNASYNTVILHVVYEADERVVNQHGRGLPTLEIRRRIPAKLIENYQRLLHNEAWIPCEKQFGGVSRFLKTMFYDQLLVERLQRKTAAINEAFAQTHHDWNATCYWLIARSFGISLNKEPFELVARSVPLEVVGKYKNNLLQVEALLFGQAGFLNETFEEDYPKQLQQEYQFLRKKHGLSPLFKSIWNFMRLRPANFPTVRLAQLAMLLHRSSGLFSKILESENVQAIEQLFNAEPSAYWLTHYQLGKLSKPSPKRLGKTTIHLIIINTIAPLLFFYGQQKGEEAYTARAFELLEHLPPESNSIISQWQTLGEMPENAYQTQALLQLYNQYCQPKHCLQCAICNQILKENG